jgi:GntR family transcriptional regulator, transcriptional repressor for pyruvate dehydrogenase complex
MSLKFQSVRPQASLTVGIVEQIREAILDGRLKSDDRLPTEQELMSSFNVSRTVVREAIAALRADGLVRSRQGSGVFVADPASRRPFRLAPGGLQSLTEVIQLLELRTGVESECAALAAERRTEQDLVAMREMLEQIDGAINAGTSAHELDFALHRLIAQSTSNPFFLLFLDQFGPVVIPRRSVELDSERTDDRRAYLQRSQAEHRALFAAIESGDRTRASRLMRRHIANGLQRYRSLQPETNTVSPDTLA